MEIYQENKGDLVNKRVKSEKNKNKTRNSETETKYPLITRKLSFRKVNFSIKTQSLCDFS